MKHLFFKSAALAAMMATLAACDKTTLTDDPVPEGKDAVVELKFVSPEGSRAFGAGTTETWEKEVKTATVIAYNAAGAQLLRRDDLTAAQINGSTTTPVSMVLPNVNVNDAVDFYVIINRTIDATVTTKAGLLALLESDIASYNGTYANVTTKASRTAGFVMAGTQNVKIVSGVTPVTITVKRIVAKLEVQCTMTAAFRSKYGNGCVQIKKVTLSKGAEKSYLIDQTTAKYAAVSSSFTSAQDSYCDQTGASKPNQYKYNNLFYINEKAAANAGSRVKLVIEAVYDADGNLTTTADQVPVSYETELTGTTGGKIVRNGSYMVNAKIDGLTGQDVTLAITVANWDTLSSQDVNLGE